MLLWRHCLQTCFSGTFLLSCTWTQLPEPLTSASLHTASSCVFHSSIFFNKEDQAPSLGHHHQRLLPGFLLGLPPHVFLRPSPSFFFLCSLPPSLLLSPFSGCLFSLFLGPTPLCVLGFGSLKLLHELQGFSGNFIVRHFLNNDGVVTGQLTLSPSNPLLLYYFCQTLI